MKRMKLLFTLALPVLLSQNTQAQHSRLIAQAHLQSTGAVFVPVDTTNYTYSGDRGGDLTKANPLLFDWAVSRVWSGDTAWANSLRVHQVFPSLSSTLIDHSIMETAPMGSFSPSSQVKYFYNSAGKETISIYSVWNGSSSFSPYSRDTFYYNATGQLMQDEYALWAGGSVGYWVNNSIKTYTYDGSNNLASETDASKVGSVYQYTSMTTWDYTSNHLTQMKKYAWDNATMHFIESGRYQYSYDTTSTPWKMLTETYATYDATTMSYTNQTLKSYSAFTGMMPGQEDDFKWDTAGSGHYYETMVYNYTYNSHNQLLTSVGESFSAAGFPSFALGDPMGHYYYEDYIPASVANTSAAEVAVNIFPVPAQNILNISLDWATAQAATISIFDMNGSLVRLMNTPVVANYSATIPVMNLATGNYIIKIKGTDGEVVRNFNVIH